MTKGLIKFALAGVALLAAAGCGSTSNGPEQALTIKEEHPISVDSQVVTLTIGRRPEGLSDLDTARLRAFADAYLNNGHGPITITSPTGGSDQAESDALAASTRETLSRLGVNLSDVRESSYVAANSATGDIILSYTHYVATASACGIWKGVRGRDYRNMRSPNFGCSAQSNLAAMITDPHDLIRPATMTAPDSAIRIRGVKAFREGQDTSSARSGDIEIRVGN